jgi:BirA family transcriptional regulator, biotin operon repressor / biotin---[acetyl-CoA-carboxylase] ligase
LADSLAPDVLEPLLAGRFGRPYLYREPCDEADRMLDASLPEGATSACEGEGAAILCWVLLRPQREHRASELSLVGAVATAELVEAALGLSAQIKWPNDVMVDRQKVGSVRVESHGGATLFGIEVNVNQSRSELPEAPQVPAASLLTIDARRRERAPLLADLLLLLERTYDQWLEGGLDALYAGLGARDFLRGRKVLVDGRSGTAIGVDRDGRLAIDLGGERLDVESGPVSYER